MKNVGYNKLLKLILFSIISISFLVNYQIWNDSVFKFIIFGYEKINANVVSVKNYDAGGYSYSEVKIQYFLFNDEMKNTILLKSVWIDESAKSIEVYVNRKYPKLVTNKSNLIINSSIIVILMGCFYYWVILISNCLINIKNHVVQQQRNIK